MAVYNIISFLQSAEILINPDIQERVQYPFTMQWAKKFFDNFVNDSFHFDGFVGSIVIYDGKENLPRHSYASGFLFSQSIDEINNLGNFPDPIGSIQFEYGGNTTTPYISVTTLRWWKSQIFFDIELHKNWD